MAEDMGGGKEKVQMRFSVWLAMNVGLAYFGFGVLRVFITDLIWKPHTSLGIEGAISLSVLGLCVLALRYLHTRVRRV